MHHVKIDSALACCRCFSSAARSLHSSGLTAAHTPAHTVSQSGQVRSVVRRSVTTEQNQHQTHTTAALNRQQQQPRHFHKTNEREPAKKSNLNLRGPSQRSLARSRCRRCCCRSSRVAVSFQSSVSHSRTHSSSLSKRQRGRRAHIRIRARELRRIERDVTFSHTHAHAHTHAITLTQQQQQHRQRQRATVSAFLELLGPEHTRASSNRTQQAQHHTQAHTQLAA